MSDQRKYNKGPKIFHRRLTERVIVLLTPTMLHAIEKSVKKGKYANKSEFIRLIVINHLNKMKEW